ncbi:hypothetical protein [Deinococcus hohokamensis]|uniref:Uncharacterized protein n=1 Tax=Deinococcus hohokamensis TaxID=309883 RepID=A0ABV9I4C3_9DEIO
MPERHDAVLVINQDEHVNCYGVAEVLTLNDEGGALLGWVRLEFDPLPLSWLSIVSRRYLGPFILDGVLQDDWIEAEIKSSATTMSEAGVVFLDATLKDIRILH